MKSPSKVFSSVTLPRLEALAAELPEPIYLVSGVRTRREQRALYQARRRGGRPVARPGTSTHEFGLAVDIHPSSGRLWQLVARRAPAYGLRTLKNDPGHLEVWSGFPM